MERIHGRHPGWQGSFPGPTHVAALKTLAFLEEGPSTATPRSGYTPVSPVASRIAREALPRTPAVEETTG